MKKKSDSFEFKVGSYRSGIKYKNALKLLSYLEEIEPNKIYGISKAESGIIIVSKDEAILKNKLRNFIDTELNAIDENKNINKDILNGMKSAYLAIENIFLE